MVEKSVWFQINRCMEIQSDLGLIIRFGVYLCAWSGRVRQIITSDKLCPGKDLSCRGVGRRGLAANSFLFDENF